MIDDNAKHSINEVPGVLIGVGTLAVQVVSIRNASYLLL